jgi:hypothetical protein
MCGAKGDVRFTPNSDRESGHVPMVMSAEFFTASALYVAIVVMWVAIALRLV